MEAGGHVSLPQKVLFTDPSSDDVELSNLDLKGELSNVREMIVGFNAKVVFYSTSNTAVTPSLVDSVATASFYQLDVVSGGLLQVSRDSDTQFTLMAHNVMKFHFGSHVTARNLKLEAQTVYLAHKSTIELDGIGHGAEKGPGAGSTDGLTGTGATHGGCGGAQRTVWSVGSIYNAVGVGSGGGNGNGIGGAGGGALSVKSTSVLHLDGVISANGVVGQEEGGGGSGGSINIETLHLVGAGALQVKGGDGGKLGGSGGGGGRIVLSATGDYNFTKGEMHISGGSVDASSPTAIAGGSGTMLITITRLNAPYHMLVLDNSEAVPSQALREVEGTYLEEGENTEITLNELILKSNVDLFISGTSTQLTAKELHCVQDSTLHIPDTVVFMGDTEMTETIIPCSFKVAADGEIRLPLKVTFLGKGNEFAGAY